ncbi:MAG: NAD(P)/FAD-dependent oxidoreductase [Jatrophihabitantaceae bacterium]
MAEITPTIPDRVDVVVIGGGPGGTGTAIRLAQAGRSVLVLERQSFPRFHIGESGLPPTILVLKELGALEKIMEQGYVTKRGAEFSGGTRGRYGRIPFDGQGPGRQSDTIQIERAHFDNTLSQFAKDNGVQVVHEATVNELLLDGERVVGVRYTYQGEQRAVHAEYVVDAAGRGSKVAQTFGLRKTVDQHRMVAVFQHFTNLDESKNPGVEGDIQIGEHGEGWVWAIPIWDDTISVGAVMPRDLLQAADSREAIFNEHVGRIERIGKRLEGTKPAGELKIETDYSYYADTIAGPGWFMVGDAACFFDPIFSAGVMLALTTGLRAADTINEILDNPERAEALQHKYSNFYKTGYDMYARLIAAYYEAGYSLRTFLKSAGWDISGDELGENKWVCRLVSGDFWNDRNVLVQHLLSQPRWNIFEPFEREWGCPFYDELNIAEAAEEASSSTP